MKKYEKPAVKVIEILPDMMIMRASDLIMLGIDDDYVDFEDGMILPEDYTWD